MGTPNGQQQPSVSGTITELETKQYFTWMGAMYVADERLAKNYGGLECATSVRDTMAVYAERILSPRCG